MRVRYALTADGLNIGYAVIGSGEPVVYARRQMSPSITFDAERIKSRFPELLESRSIVIWDPRNFGVSDASPTPLDLDGLVLDLEAVVDQLGSDAAIDLLGFMSACHVAIAYAVRHPQHIRRLGLWNPWIGPAMEASGGAAWTHLREADFEAWADLVALRSLGWDHPEEARRTSESLKRSWTAESYKAFLELIERLDSSEMARAVSAPSLVLVERQLVRYRGLVPSGGAAVIERAGRRIAASIPNAELMVAPDPIPGPGLFASFFHQDHPAVAQADQAKVSGGTVTVLFSDLVGHTEMMRRLGDAKGRAVLREHERITRDLLNRHGGKEIKTGGDSFMVSFGSVTAALDCAIALQRAFAAHDGEPLQVRIGLNAGEPIEEDGDLFGSTVIMASRIAARASAGEILIPEPLRHLLTGKSYVYADRGEATLKGFEDAVRLYEVRWQDDG